MADLATFSVYVLRCADGSLYTGISTDVERRLIEHSGGKKGARYLRGRGPLTLVWSREIGDRSLASRVESRVRKLSPQQKGDCIALERAVSDLLPEFVT